VLAAAICRPNARDPSLNGTTMKLWEVATGRERVGFELDRSHVYSLTFAPDGRTLAATTAGLKAGSIELWDVATGQRRSPSRSVGWPLAFTPDGKLLAAPHSENVRLIDTVTGDERVLRGGKQQAKGKITSLAIAPDGNRLAVGYLQGPLELWELATGEVRTKLIERTGVPRSSVDALAFSRDGKRLAAGFPGGVVKVWMVRP
jgi:WD40 repeat protein